jgi:hypothetical protein
MNTELTVRQGPEAGREELWQKDAGRNMRRRISKYRRTVRDLNYLFLNQIRIFLPTYFCLHQETQLFKPAF